jgi:CRP-like cAMP-binding protein
MDIKTAPDAHKLVCKKLHYEYHEEGREILVKGGDSDKFYIIIEGAVSVINIFEEAIKDEETGEIRTNEIEEELANLDKGDHFGEIGIIKN